MSDATPHPNAENTLPSTNDPGESSAKDSWFLMGLLAVGSLTIILVAYDQMSRNCDERILQAERRLEAANRRNDLAITALVRDVTELRAIMVRSVSKDLLGGSAERFTDESLLISSDARQWTEETRAEFRQAIAARWRGAVFSLAEQLDGGDPINRGSMLPVFGNKKAITALPPEEQERVVALATDVSFRLFYDAAYSVHLKAAIEPRRD